MMSRRSNSTSLPAGSLASCLLVLLFLLPSAWAVSFDFPHLSNTEKDNILLVGDASATYDGIHLSKVTYGEDLLYSMGRAVYSNPIPLWDPKTRTLASFTTNFSIHIGNVARKDFNGDGAAFIIAANGTFIPDGAVGGYLGLFSNETISPSWGDEGIRRRKLVAVEFDTYPNPWDPNHMHLGIDVENIESVTHDYWTEYRNQTINTTVEATVSYDASTKNLSASMVDGNGSRASVNLTIDLTQVLPSYVYVGFSASTGLNVEHHRLIGWSFSSTLDHISSISAPGAAYKSKPMSIRILVVLGVAAGTGAAQLAVFAFGAWLWCRFPRRSSIDPIREMGPREFRYRELRDATANFSKHRELGRGSFGVVYRGTLNDIESTDVAVKKFTRGSTQGRDEFIAEVTVISRIRHRSLVKLLGWCHERGEFLLVYEFMPNRSLDHHLFSRQKQPNQQRHNPFSSSDQSSTSSSSSTGVLTWSTRYRVAVDLASALHYLHDECDQYVIHRDIKPNNILLDMHLNAKLSDFGLARMIQHGLSMPSAVLLAGTPGYVAPECFVTQRSTKQSDVYSFGVVTLEIATGRSTARMMQEDPENTEGLLGWIWELYKEGKLMDIADRTLNMEFDREEMERLLIVGLWCTGRDPAKRPSIGNVLATLRLEVPLPALPERISPQEIIRTTLNVDATTSTNGHNNATNTGASSVFASAVSVYP